MPKHKANVHGASVGKGGLTDQMASRTRSDGSTAGGDAISGTSIFDPVLAELLIRWFSGPSAVVLDPFAGGSVRGIVSAMLGRHYTGVDLREEQCVANAMQGDTILNSEEAEGTCSWFAGDSAVVLPTLAIEADFIMTCPPYANLEVYSDHPRDISNMKYPDFLRSFEEIMRLACEKLKDGRFVAIVIGDARDKDGCYLGLPAHTVSMMQRIGLRFYNEAILLTPAGTLPARARLGFVRGRKLGRTHQVVLVFVKGSPKVAVEACGECDFGSLDPFSGDQPEVEPGSDPFEGLGEIL